MTLEELQENLLKEQEKNTELNTKYNSLVEENKKLKESNERLVDYNNKLFMRVTTERKEEEPNKELTEEEKEQEYINDVIKLMEE